MAKIKQIAWKHIVLWILWGSFVPGRGLKYQDVTSLGNNAEISRRMYGDEDVQARMRKREVERNFHGDLSTMCHQDFVSEAVAPLTLVTVAFGMAPDFVQALLRNRLREAAVAGYEVCLFTDSHMLRSSTHPEAAWAKIAALRYLLEHGRAVVAVLDADAVIVNTRRFEPIVQEPFDQGKSVVFTQDCHNTGLWSPHPRQLLPHGLNSGVFVSRNTTWAKKFWTEIWNMPMSDETQWWEQGAIFLYWEYYPEDFEKNTIRLDVHSMNTCPGNFTESDFIWHGYADIRPRKLLPQLKWNYTARWLGLDNYSVSQSEPPYRGPVSRLGLDNYSLPQSAL